MIPALAPFFLVPVIAEIGDTRNRVIWTKRTFIVIFIGIVLFRGFRFRVRFVVFLFVTGKS